ncbi:MAG: TIGR01777 family oxidoreductase [Phycisphaeraceae bacterium]|nr:TIGR01777 family oxidoreductase [Phycisphaeraceae bacterium]
MSNPRVETGHKMPAAAAGNSPAPRKPARPQHVLISGSSGLLGSALAALLTSGGHRVTHLRRSGAGRPDEVPWEPNTGRLDLAALGELPPVDAVIHLAGQNIAARRWTAAFKASIRDTRVLPTRLLATTVARLDPMPSSFLCASAVGFYGDRRLEELTEESPPGEGFLAKTCQEWEEATLPAEQAGMRTVQFRLGMVLTPKGGALKPMLLPAKLGLAGPVGSGRQYWSWISLDDALDAILHLLINPHLTGPANLVSPSPVTNRQFIKTLGRVVHRPAWFPLPAFAARLALGEMADALLLASQRVIPRRLSDSGFTFQYANLESALGHLLGQQP